MLSARVGLCLLIVVLAAGCGRETPSEDRASSPGTTAILAAPESGGEPLADSTVGSTSCQSCHEDFYKLWRTSWHGLAMQPFTEALAKEHLTPQQEDVVIGKRRYRAELDQGEGMVREVGPDGTKDYPIVQVMGGKNTYYFLTPMERGRLQVLPVAYEVHKKEWYDTAASGVRHFPDRTDEALDWTHRSFTFNTSCFNCHVSEISTNYSLATNTYHTTWREPGISCESCHGPGGEHVRAMEAGAKGNTSEALKIIRTVDFTHRQMNDMCATCHAKMMPLSMDFLPGDRFFDHYDLRTLEDPDFYPDGRDLGENYTYTTWLQSGCAKSDTLDCNHCHTPSGRPQFSGEESNQFCMPCHEAQVNDSVAHGHHEPGSEGNQCVACHMPMTRFAAMNRSDHSMRPPTPATTIAFESPNACNMCHADQDAAWADQWARKWYGEEYQAEIVEKAGLLDAARKEKWDRLPEMLDVVDATDGDMVYRNSLVRLVADVDDPRVQSALVRAMKDPTPLVRASAAVALGRRLDERAVQALLAATADPSRLVRIRSATALAAIEPEQVADPQERQNLRRAVEEFKEAMSARPDDWATYATVGNFYMERRDFDAAVAKFKIAADLAPDVIGPWVNAAIAYSNLGRNREAEAALRRALALEPKNAAANFNLGLLLGETGQVEAAEVALRTALKADPQMAAAAYNLGVILGKKDLDEAVYWCRKAHELQPNDPKYAQALAFFLRKQGHADEADELLRQAAGPQ